MSRLRSMSALLTFLLTVGGTAMAQAQTIGPQPFFQPLPQQFQPIALPSSAPKGNSSAQATFPANNAAVTTQTAQSSNPSPATTGIAPQQEQSSASSFEGANAPSQPKEPPASSSDAAQSSALTEQEPLGTAQMSRPRHPSPPRYHWEQASSVRSSIPSSSSSSFSSSEKRPEFIRSSARSKQAASSQAPLIITAPQGTGTVLVSRPFDRTHFGYTVPIVDPESLATPLTVRGFRFWWFNLILAIISTFLIVLSRAALQSNLPTAPLSILQFLRRLPLSAAVFLVLAIVKSLLLPTASAQETGSITPSVAWLVPLYAIAFFVVAGTTNFVCNNFVGAEAATLERIFLPEHRTHEHIAWKRHRGIILIFFLLYAAIGAHINTRFSLLPISQPGIALVALLTIIVAAYAKDGMRFALAHAHRFSPWLEANALGLLLALLSIWLTRALALSPGYLFGVPAGVFIVHHGYAKREGPFELAGLLSMLACALIAWLLLPLLAHLQVVSDFLRLLIVILLEACFFESLPTAYTAGGSLIRWKKWVWALQMTLATFLTLQLLWNPKSTLSSLASSPPGLTYVVLLAIYILFVGALVGYCRLRRKASA